jgi:hypothetical protein
MKGNASVLEQTLKSKYHLRGVESRSDKPHQHRYERRKLRLILREWDLDEN